MYFCDTIILFLQNNRSEIKLRAHQIQIAILVGIISEIPMMENLFCGNPNSNYPNSGLTSKSVIFTIFEINLLL